jgi:2Fe-2S ferredoxin|tara:strand:- start:55 stop:375 length:321 start_codon:yes stop_codon:yes gene_type:complete
MPKITYISHEGKKNTVDVAAGLSVMEGAIQNNIEGIDADCGGSMACATCHVYIPENWLNKMEKTPDAEQDMIDMAYEPKKNSRLSCQIIVTNELDGLEVTTPLKQT